LAVADQAQSADQVISEKELIVGTKEAPPFVMKRSDGTLYGISIDLWRRVAEATALTLPFFGAGDDPGLLKGTEEGSVDAAIAALTATAARETSRRFHPAILLYGFGRCRAGERKRMDFGLTYHSFLWIFQAVLALLGIAICVGCWSAKKLSTLVVE